MPDIFISYKREEQPIARILADALIMKGWTVWWDPKLRAGEHFDDAIEKALIDAKCVIVMWSKLSVNSRYVKDEATFALNRGKLVPIAIEEVDLPFRFEGIQTERLINWDGSDNFPGFKKLVADIAGILGRLPIAMEEREQEKDERKLIDPLATEKAFSDLKTVLRGQKETSLGERINRFVVDEEPSKPFKNSIGMEFILIPAGKFMMGGNISPEETAEKYGCDAKDYKNEHPQHEVTITKPFYLQYTQVTQGKWQKVMGDNPSECKDCGDDCPVEDVSWYDVQNFINKLNEMEDSEKYRLPTEAEWEYACRAGTTSDFSFGDGVKRLGEYGWYKYNYDDGTNPVGTKNPNAWGLYDMHGNVDEWCQDWYGHYPSNSVVDPIGPSVGKLRVIRGGACTSFPGELRCTARNHMSPNAHSWTLGFRCVRTLE